MLGRAALPASRHGRGHYFMRVLSTEAARPKPRVWPFYFAIGSILGGGLYLLGREDASDPEAAQRPFPVRVWNRMGKLFQTFEDPAFEKLLPDPVVDPNNPRRFTLVVDLDKFLINHKWNYGKWEIVKRPGLELFLFYAAQLFEVVVFSSLPQQEADQYVKMIDPYGCVSYGLYRFATKYRRGTYLKDISHLNRDMAKVLVLGHDEAGFSPHPENFIKVDPWEPKKDTVLEDLVDFLEMVAFSRVDDVRTIAQQFQGQTFPDAFEALQERLYDTKKEAQKNSLPGRIGSLFSFGKAKDAHAASVQDDSYRARKQERTEMRRKEYARIKELMQKQLEAEMEREKQYYAEHKMSLVDVLSRGPPPPAPKAA